MSKTDLLIGAVVVATGVSAVMQYAAKNNGRIYRRLADKGYLPGIAHLVQGTGFLYGMGAVFINGMQGALDYKRAFIAAGEVSHMKLLNGVASTVLKEYLSKELLLAITALVCTALLVDLGNRRYIYSKHAVDYKTST